MTVLLAAELTVWISPRLEGVVSVRVGAFLTAWKESGSHGSSQGSHSHNSSSPDNANFSTNLLVRWQQLSCLTLVPCHRVLQMTLSMQFSSVSTNMFLSPPGSLFYLLMATKWLRVAGLEDWFKGCCCCFWECVEGEGGEEKGEGGGEAVCLDSKVGYFMGRQLPELCSTPVAAEIGLHYSI